MLRIETMTMPLNGGMVLNDISMDLAGGEIIGIIGKAGSGKSILLETMSGGRTGYDGALILLDRPLREYKKKELALLISPLCRNIRVNHDDTVFDFLLLSRAGHKKILSPFSETDREAVNKYIGQLGLRDIAGKKLYELSECAFHASLIASSFIRESPILLMDNPDIHLDLPALYRLRTAIQRYVINGDRVVIMASNNINFIAQTCDRIYILDGGRIAATGTVDIINSRTIKQFFGIDAVTSKNIYNGKPEVHFFPEN